MCAPAAMPRPGLDHAAEHHAEPERARRVHHAHRLADAARLRELDVDAVRALGARGDVGERVAVLVDVDRDRRAPLQLRARPGRRRRAAARSTAARSCGRYSSASSSVHASLTSHCSGRSVTARTARTRSASSPSRPPSFSFSRLNPRRSDLLRAPRHVVRVAEPDRPRRRRPGPAQAEQLVDRLAGELALQVVSACVDRRARRVLARRQARRDLVERERVVAELDAARATRAPTAADSS